MKKIEHIGIAVYDLESSIKMYSSIFNIAPYKEEVVESEGVKVAFFRIGESKIELLESINETGAIKKFLEKKGEGIHHIAFEVDDINTEIKRLQTEGYTVLNAEPKAGADNKLVCFLHPKETGKVLIELCQPII